jgi:hypothetical protein
MSENTVITLAYCTLFSTLIPIIFGVVKWNKLSIAFKAFIGCYSIYFILFALSFYLPKIDITSNIIPSLSDIHSTITYSSFIYFSTTDTKFRKVVLIASSLIVFMGLIDLILKSILKSDINLHSNPIGNAFNILLIIVFLTKMFYKLRNVNLSKNTTFLVLIAILIPASYSFFYEAFSELLIKENVEIYIMLYGASFIIYTSRNFVFTYCILKSKNTSPFKNL